jgi:restriction system protein
MEIPKFHETFFPILEVLRDGKTMHFRELYQIIKKNYFSNLTDEQLKEQTKSGDILIDNRIGWGKAYLKKGGYIEYPQRGYVKITEKGKNQKQDITLNELVDESTVFEFYKEENGDKKSIKKQKEIKATSSPQDLIDEGFTRIEQSVKSDLLSKLKGLGPIFFRKGSFTTT